MRQCPYCKVGIEGDLVKCPLCQSKLTGTGEDPCYPKFEAQKKRSLLYKIQLLLAWGVLIVGIGLDFMVGLRLPGYPKLHWSLLLAMWLMVIEFGIMRQFKPGTGSAGKVTMLVLITIATWCVTAYFFGFMKTTIDLVVPCALAATITANFVLAMIVKNGNTMAYLLSGLIMGVVPSVICFFARDKMPLAWAICLMVSVVLFAGAVIFKGRAVAAELRRRFHV
ncbi:MAG: hypothetical protein J6Y20_03890 [Lachnospiraceae bacterium]|nr:hypothetical protein [Lachnospiraceae bacterium]